MAKKETITSDKISWIEKPLNLGAVVLGLAITLFTGGMGIGGYKRDLEQQVATLKKDQECSERVQEEKEKCSEYRRNVDAQKMESLEKTVESIKSIRKGRE